MQYTVYSDPEVDRIIEQDLCTIKEALTEHFNSVHTLILAGGFGRGEGSVLYENGIPKPINDYDIVMIVEDDIYRSELKNMSETIARNVDIRLIDLIPIKKENLPRLPCTMFNYDLKYGNHVFYGDKNIVERIPQYTPTEITLEEGKKLLFNRMICLLESYSEEFSKREPYDDEKFFIANQTSKAILACCDSLLLQSGNYHHSYVERNKLFSELFSSNKEMISLVRWATEFKTKPYGEIDFDVVKHWFKTCNTFLATVSDILESLYQKSFNDWIEFSQFYLHTSRPTLKRFLDTIRGKRQTIRKIKLELAEIFLLATRANEAIDERYLKKGFENLRYIGALGKKVKFKEGSTLESSWEELRKICVELWFTILH